MLKSVQGDTKVCQFLCWSKVSLGGKGDKICRLKNIGSSCFFFEADIDSLCTSLYYLCK